MQVSVLAATLAACSLGAQTRFEYWPGAAYNPAIPTYRKVLGYDAGERLTSHAGLVRYVEALAAAAPSRIRLFDYGKTWQGRRLIYAAVGSEENIRRLDEIRAGMKKLADPRRTPAAEAQKLVDSLPAVIWLGYGVHGDELSSPEAALLTAYHLLASRNNKLVDAVLANTVVLIDPTQNPDGRTRFVHHFEQTEGIEPDPTPTAAEHTQPWPGGRTNHYHFDMNRDWFALTQPESRGRVKALLEWYPLVFADLHEMGADATYYFAPEADPFNPHLAKDQRDALELFGRNNARWFDDFGFSYFTREIFDAFYPGYGASWPSYYGSVAMTYEQASTRGLAIRRGDERVMYFRETVRQHFVASVATCETAAVNRRKLLEGFLRYRRTAIEEGQKEPVREYILPRRGDFSLVDKLAGLLAEQGVEVKRALAPFQAGGKEYPAGSYVVPLSQPAKRLVRVLLDPHVAMDEKFIKEQERRRGKKLGDEVYDVTAWSLPLMYNVECVAAGQASEGKFEAVAAGTAPAGGVRGDKAAVAYLAPWGTTAAGRLLTAALREGIIVWSSDKSFTQKGRKYPRGTLIIKVKENPATIDESIRKLAASSGAEVFPTDTGWVEEGVNFGSSNVLQIRRPSIALAWDRPVSSGSAGHTRYVLERQYNYPVSVIRTEALNMTDLTRFQVLILPEGGAYAAVLGPAGIAKLKSWVASGGTVVAIGSATAFLGDPKVGLLAVQQESLARPGADAAKEPARRPETTSAPENRAPGKLLASEEDLLKAIQAESELPDAATGVLVRAKTDPDHWLTAGAAETLVALVQGRSIYTPVRLDKGVNAAYFLGPGQLLAGGYLWEENRRQLAFKPLVIAGREGRGQVIAFTADPNYRAYLDGMNVMFLNAVFRGPAHARTPSAAELED